METSKTAFGSWVEAIMKMNPTKSWAKGTVYASGRSAELTVLKLGTKHSSLNTNEHKRCTEAVTCWASWQFPGDSLSFNHLVSQQLNNGNPRLLQRP